jgi:tetratricopeptide (TPR) repeat protein
MKRIITVFAMLALTGYGFAQSLVSPPSGNNQKAKVVQNIGPVEISIAYSSPHVHTAKGDDRTGHIWGELVHYGFADQGFGVKSAPWRAGANENTIVKFSHDVKIEGKDLKAGSYGLFLATAKDGPWTWIFSTNTSSWGSFFYNQSEDALRVDVTPKDAPFTEYLTYGFDDRQPSSATAYLQWESKRIPFKIEVADVNNMYVSMMRDQLRSTVGFDYRNFSQAANFCATNKINLDEALTWADRAMNPLMGGKEEMITFQAKAAVLRASGKDADADALMDKAIKSPSTSVAEIHQYARGLLNSGKKEKAMEVFKYNAEKNLATDKFTPNVGLARGYTAMGDTKNAIKYWEEAIKNIPESQKPFIKTYQGELDKLKAGK